MKTKFIFVAMIFLAACAPPAAVPTATATISVTHVVDSYPKQDDQFARVPDKVLVNFDIALEPRSNIAISRDGKPVQTGAIAFGPNKISMFVALPNDAGDGQFVAKFQGCFRDQSCNDGQFSFVVDSKSVSTYTDFTGKSDVTIRMKDIKFTPALIRVSPGTKVTWTNDDPIPHFVNSDPHPSHNAIQPLNSFDLAKDASYNFTFDQPGEWSYHCSAHVPANMYGRVLVVPAAQSSAPPQIAQAQATATAPRAAATAIPRPSVTPTPSKRKVALDQLPPEIFAAHYVLSEPEHAEILSRVPARIRIEFNFNLHNASNLTVLRDGKEVKVGKVEVGQFSLEANPPGDLGDGMYLVRYKACWPDRSCHDGQFVFIVASAK